MIKLPEAANHILLTAIDAVKPDQLIKQKISIQDDILKVEDREFDLKQYHRVYVIGAGKASAVMAREMENLLGERIFYGVISVKYWHSKVCRKLRILESGHPVLDENGILATSQILQVANDAQEHDREIPPGSLVHRACCK